MSSVTKFQPENIQDLIKDWLQQERNGVKFPVPFDMAWEIAGYKKRQDAYISIENNLIEEEEFLRKSVKNHSRGRPKRSFDLSCDGFKQFCLLARTDAGRQIRQYFIEAEKNWQLVQENHPQVAQDTELEKLKLQAEIADKQCRATEAHERCLKHSEQIYNLHGAQVTAFLRGDRDSVLEVEKPTTEVIDKTHNVSFKGQTLKQVSEYLKQKFGIKFKSGADLKRYLEKHDMAHLVGQTPRSIVADYIPDENLQELYNFLGKTRQQKLIGE
mgnify:CR=1 FL=1